MICAGIDAGSRVIKVVVLDAETREIMAKGCADQGVEQDTLASELFSGLLRDCGISRDQVASVVATGYGRNRVSFADAAITEITCHAYGVHHLFPDAMTIVEIGGQDSKLIRLNARGMVQDFAMNDRCAAGTGRFLEMVASQFGVGLSDLGVMARGSTSPAAISSTCVVFAETEIIGLLASGIPPADIAAGVQASIASRIRAMAGRFMSPPVVFTGGVALVPGMADVLQVALDLPVATAPEPLMTGALGAALLAGHSHYIA